MKLECGIEKIKNGILQVENHRQKFNLTDFKFHSFYCLWKIIKTSRHKLKSWC